MPDKSWKAFERVVDRFFGGDGRTGPMQSKDASDIKHDNLHVQCKHYKRFQILSMWDAAKKAAKHKIPVLAIKQKGRHGFWLLVHSSDLTAVSNQREIVIKEENS